MYRNTDPETSRLAAEQQETTGAVSMRRSIVHALVLLFPGLSHAELATKMYERHPHLGIIACAETPHKRLPELEKRGLVRTGESRICSVTGHKARTWYSTREDSNAT